VIAGVLASRRLGIGDLAFGYVAYQNEWPEQTPLATSRLRSILGEFDVRLHLPVYEIASKAALIQELARYSLNDSSLEQKCLIQVDNTVLDKTAIDSEIALWEASTRAKLDNAKESELTIISDQSLREI